MRVLVALYPRTWQRQYGEEFAALLEDAGIGPRVVFDVVLQATRCRYEHHRRVVLLLGLLVWTSGLEYLAARTRIAANILWAPTDPVRALSLLATVGPWTCWCTRAVLARRRRRRFDATASAS